MEEIDLTEYLAVLVRRWRLLIGAAFAFTLVALLVIFLMPEAYQTRVLVATDTGDVPEGIKPGQRLASLVELVSSPEIAQAVLDDVGQQLPARDRSSGALREMVEGRLAPNSDTVEILVTHRDPRAAMAVANAWGEEYINHVVQTYARKTDNRQRRLQRAAQDAKKAYDKEQAEWEHSVRNARFDELNRRVAEYQAIIGSVSSVREITVQGLLDQVRRLDLLLVSAYDMRDQVLAGGSSAATSSGPALALLKTEALVAGEEARRPSQLSMPVARAHPMDQPTPRLRAVENTTQEPTGEHLVIEDTSSPPPVIAPLQQRSEPSSQLQIQAVAGDAPQKDMAKDLRALIVVLEARRDMLQDELTRVLEAASQGGEYVFWSVGRDAGDSDAKRPDKADEHLAEITDQLEGRLRDVRVQLAREQSRLEEARARRDLAWETYNALAGVDAESAITGETRGTSVRLAASATVPSGSTTNKPRNSAMAAITGLVIGVVAVYAAELWRNLRARSASVAEADRPEATE